MLKGAVHFISRTPESLDVTTPFVNAAIEGTEFVVRVEPAEAGIWVFEGQVLARNARGRLMLGSGEAAVTKQGRAPERRLVVKPREVVQWALYYPPLFDTRREAYPPGPDRETIQAALARYHRGDLPGAFAHLDRVPKKRRTPRYYALRAGLLLTVGRVDEAALDIDTALKLDPNGATPYALQSVIAVTQNKQEKAMELAQKAVALDPQSPTAHVALSYAHQARFEIEKAHDSVEQAVNLDPANPLAWARLAELELSLGDLDNASAAAQKATDLDPHLGHTQTVLGFANLMRIDIEGAKLAFDKAIELEPAFPLARLGLGLAMIRQGHLKKGTQEIETAAILDPDNSLIRSYLGKAYYEEKRSKLASEQFVMAKDLDPNDPTPWFYDSILLQSENRPIEALLAQQRAIALNNNRGVYRSRLLLDNDNAARNVALGRIYNDLSFEQLSRLQATEALARNPGNHSAHRLLADSYAGITNLDAARQSELLQAKLTQPLNLDPLQPQLSNANQGLLDGNGPSDLSYNEYNPLFTTNGMALQLDAAVAGQNAWSNDAIVAGLLNRFAFSLGQYHTETDGFRPNADFEQDIYNAFAQLELTENTSIQLEYNRDEEEKGDVSQRLLSEFINDPDIHVRNEATSFRFGLDHKINNHARFLFSAIQREQHFNSSDPAVGVTSFGNNKRSTDIYDTQFIIDKGNQSWLAGLSYLKGEENNMVTLDYSPFSCPLPGGCTLNFKPENRQSRFYGYYYFQPVVNLSLATGLAYIDEKNSEDSVRKAYPKLGMKWNASANDHIRLAIFRNRTSVVLPSEFATLEPTQIAGFNQLYDDLDLTDSWNYAVGYQHDFNYGMFAGFNTQYRRLESPIDVSIFNATGPPQMDRQTLEYNDHSAGIWLNWTPNKTWALAVDYYYNDYNLKDGLTVDNSRVFAPDNVLELRTHKLPISISYFHPSGFSTEFITTYYDQHGEFVNSLRMSESGEDDGWVTDLALNYRLPNRLGLITFGVKNLFDTDLSIEDRDSYDSSNAIRSASPPAFASEQLFFGKFSLNFR